MTKGSGGRQHIARREIAYGVQEGREGEGLTTGLAEVDDVADDHVESSLFDERKRK